jgi:hypothetical protein
MAVGEDGYGDLQQPGGGYQPSGSDADGYSGSHDSGFNYLASLNETEPAPAVGSAGATSSTASTSPAKSTAPVDRQKMADDLVADLAKRYQKRFSRVKKKGKKKERVTLGPDIGKIPKVEIIPENDFGTRLQAHSDVVFEEFVNSKLCLDPQTVQDKLIKLYELDGKPLPYTLPIDCRTTVLTDHDKNRLFLLTKTFLEAKIRKEADDIQGFFEETSGVGTITLREGLFTGDLALHILVTTVAHELAHAYAFGGWDFFLSDMIANGLKKAGDLDEGMATELGDRIAKDWFSDQPNNTLVPPKPYGKEQWAAAAVFMKAVTEAKALEAFFGGFIKLKDFANPKGDILVGDAKPKTWTWPWR